jgi:hypothetical protein
MPTMPLLLPLLAPLLPLLPPLLLLAPLLLLLPPLLLLDVASPPSPWGAMPLVLPPQPMNGLPVPSPTRRATHTTRALRRRNMRQILAGVVPKRPSP